MARAGSKTRLIEPDTMDMAAEVLSTLARLDLEAALAYEAGAEVVAGTRELQAQFLRFREDHLKHVLGLNRALRSLRHAPLVHSRQATEGYLLRSLALLGRPFGPGALVLVLLTDEQLTNGIYELALRLDWDDEVTDLLQRNAADGQRHFLWLADRADELTRREDLVPPSWLRSRGAHTS